ncbi:hypothetical protein [Streptomyces niveus]|uniref:hypothetical protein n=1 Tax=Streptomyces niveus TaxID=193462 RepID=UPI00084C3897|nr:hypothetical protein [Streptomyces niveus]
MTDNPFADDPTTASEFIDGRWVDKGRTYTTHDVAAAQQRLTDAVGRIEGRRELSAEAKRIAIARAYKEARDTVAAAGEEHIEQVQTQRRILGRKVFGQQPTSDTAAIVSRRDADARVAGLEDPRQGEQLLAQAERNGDEHLARAVAAHAADFGWHDVLSTYASSRPDAIEGIQQIQELPDTDDPVFRLQHAMTYSVVQPAQLDGLPDYSVDALAASDLEVA